MKILLNHVGYRPGARKRAIVQDGAPLAATGFVVVETSERRIVHAGRLEPLPGVPGWKGRHFAAAEFTPLVAPGRHVVMLEGPWPTVASHEFEIGESLFGPQMLSDIVHYFKSQRCTGIFDAADRHAPLLDTREARDVHGGWYDASGDCSKYLSHLSYANFMNPQQTPLVTWALLDGLDRIPPQSKWLAERIVDEALHGADFLLRMQAPEGFFYTTVFDRWSKDETQREICAYATQQGHKSADYQAGLRQGGGLAVAALARAAGAPRDGAVPRSRYLEAAVRGFEVLEARNTEFLDDHRENLIDHYCALLGAAELHARTGDARWARAAARRVQAMQALRRDEGAGYWMDEARTRSFFHASDAGLPHIALMRHVEVSRAMDREAPTQLVRAMVSRDLMQELHLTEEGDPNPFGYPRQYVAMPGREPAVRFFIPHDNESGYWWQGENARLGSLAAAARMAARLDLFEGDVPGDEARRRFGDPLDAYADRIVDWILGANPFDACMLQGWGQHPPRYEPGFWNAAGGVCNGITAGLDDEDDLDFRKPEETVPTHSWRWSEQWIPHAAWLFSALAWGLTAPPASPASTRANESHGGAPPPEGLP